MVPNERIVSSSMNRLQYDPDIMIKVKFLTNIWKGYVTALSGNDVIDSINIPTQLGKRETACGVSLNPSRINTTE